MKQNREKIERQIKRLKNYLDSDMGDDTDQRMVYNAMEILRWSIEETVGWDKPLEHSLSISKILKGEFNK